MLENTQNNGEIELGETAEQESDAPEAVKQLQGEERRKTLYDHLALLNAVDNGTIELTDDEVEELMFNTEGKIDSCKFIYDRYQRNALFWQQEKWVAEKNQKAAENGLKRLQNSMSRALQKNGFEKFPGVKWVVNQTKSEAVEVSGDLNEMLVLRYPELFKTSIVAVKTKIKDYLKKEGQQPLDFAYIKQNFGIRFSPNPEAKLDKNLRKKDMK